MNTPFPLPRPESGAPSDVLTPCPGVALRRGRVHELCGPARWRAALWLAGQVAGPVLWIAPLRTGQVPHPCGMADLIAPGRLIIARPERAEDALWCLEEALRAGAVAVAVADLPGPPALTPVRRLHLAAESAGTRPLGLILTPGDGGAPGVESRWHMAPAHTPDAPRWTLRGLRARGIGALPALTLGVGPQGAGLVPDAGPLTAGAGRVEAARIDTTRMDATRMDG